MSPESLVMAFSLLCGDPSATLEDYSSVVMCYAVSNRLPDGTPDVIGAETILAAAFSDLGDPSDFIDTINAELFGLGPTTRDPVAADSPAYLSRLWWWIKRIARKGVGVIGP
jgi:hypothetical protein